MAIKLEDAAAATAAADTLKLFELMEFRFFDLDVDDDCCFNDRFNVARSNFSVFLIKRKKMLKFFSIKNNN